MRRVAAGGAGAVIPQKKLTAAKLRTAVQTVLEQKSYRLAARRLQKAIVEANGLNRAAGIIERALGIGPAEAKAWEETIAAD